MGGELGRCWKEVVIIGQEYFISRQKDLHV